MKSLSKQPTDAGALENRIAESLPPLFEAADQVAFYANEFAQDKAVEQANDYAHIANGIERLIKNYRDLRLKEAQEAIAFVSATATSLAVWVLLCAFAAIVLIGPIGLATMHRVLSRLGRITQAMTRLARHDTTTVIPSRDDRDEVGAMARAVDGVQGQRHPAHRPRGRAQAAQPPHRHRAEQHDPRPLHVRRRAEADRLQQDLCADVRADARAAKPGTLLQAIENYRASIGNSAIANPEQMAAASAIHASEASAFTQELMDGRIVAVSQRPMQDGGSVAVHEDITERRRAEAKIAHLARHDMLTNLPNRVLFREHLENAFDAHPAGPRLCRALPRPRSFQDRQRHARPSDRRRACSSSWRPA